MTYIVPIPTSRVSEQLVRGRLLAQLQSDQRDIFRVQTQLSTGRRIFTPSEDAPAALRAIGLQRLIERKDQVHVNLAASQSFLSASDSALAASSGLVANVRGSAMSVVGTTSTAQQREAVIAEIDRVVQQLVDTGNQNFRGRYLFAGTRTASQPFHINGSYVEYVGNEGELRTFSDIDVLFESGINGNRVFGAISDPIRGIVDLNRTLGADTLLSDLREGQGISKGSIEISDGVRSSTIDLSSAVTLGDVARLIEAHPPQSTNPPVTRELRVSIKPTGLVIEIDSAGGSLSIHEVGSGTTAGELGILRQQGAGLDPVIGSDLNPKLRLTTRLDDILGARASGRVISSGTDNDFLITANTVGDAYNGVRVQLVDDELLRASAGLSASTEVAEFSATARAASGSLALSGVDNDLIFTANTPGVDFNNVSIVLENAGNIGDAATATYTDVAGVRTLTIGIDDSNETTLATLIDAVEASTPFSVSADTSAGEGFNDTTAVLTANAGAVSGNTGNSGGAANTLFVRIKSGSTTTAQTVAAINLEGTFAAEIDVRDAVNVGQAGLGIVDLAATGVTDGGSGTTFDKDSGIRLRNGGQTFDISFADALTIEDLLNTVNGAGAGVLAELNSQGSGLNLRSRLSGADFSIGENGGVTATQLGLRSFTESTRLSELNFGLGVKREVEGMTIPQPHAFTVRRNDGVEFTVDIDSADSVGDVLAAINEHPDNLGAGSVLARLAHYGNGIELVDDNPTGLDLQGQPNTIQVRTTETSQAAVFLGFVASGESVSAAATPGAIATGSTAFVAANSDITFSARQSGTALNGAKIEFVNNLAVGDQALVSYSSVTNTLTIDVDPANTRAATVVDAVANQPAGLFTAVVDESDGANDGSGLMTVTGEVAVLDGGTAEVLTAADVNPIETEGVFNTLLRLKDALQANDVIAVERTVTALEDDLERFNFARAEIGVRQQGLDVLQERLQSENVELRGSLSEEIEIDIAEAISNLTARQLTYEASLRTTGSLLQLTLLDFI